jgi:hypothetical protein
MSEWGITKLLLAVLIAASLAACSTAAPTATPIPTRTYPPVEPVYIIGRVYPFALLSHCGVSKSFPALFNGAAWTTSDSTDGLAFNIDVGTMELTSEDQAIYRSERGSVLHLTRLPGPVTSLRPCF